MDNCMKGGKAIILWIGETKKMLQYFNLFYMFCLATALQQPFHSQWNAVPGEHLSRRRSAALGGEARSVAEETQARWCHQQSTYGFLPKGVEDPAEVPRSVHRRIRVALFYHKRGRYSQTCCRFGLPAYVCV